MRQTLCIARACTRAMSWSAAAILCAACQNASHNTGAAGFAVGGSVTGLVKGASVGLADSAGDNVMVSSNGAFAFGASLPAGAPYRVTVSEEPSGESCTVANGSGTVMGADVANVSVICTALVYGLGGSVSGLLSGRSLVLQDNGADNIKIAADGAFRFPAGVPSGSNYAVTIRSQPEGQSCAITNGSGTMAAGDALNVEVACADDAFNVGVTVSGVNAAGLTLANNGGDLLSISRNGSFNFNTPVASGSAYAVTVTSQPVGEVCTVTRGAGTVIDANVAGIAVACVPNLYSIAGTLGGLYAGRSLIVQDNGGNSTTLTANGGFSFSRQLASGAGYTVTVSTQPVGQTCSVADGSGTVSGANVGNVAISCSDNTYNVIATVSGLIGAGLVLQNNGTDTSSVSADGNWSFATPLPTGAAYAVTILTQPANETCTVTNGAGTIVGANVTNVLVTCTGEWIWMGGSSAKGAGGAYGTEGSASAANMPGARFEGTAFTDATGNFWLFGGNGVDSTGTNTGDLNDLWRYDTGAGTWTWVGGASLVGAGGSYGTEGVPSSANMPGARAQPAASTDPSGNFWLFGGFGYDNADNPGPLNDLWKFNPAAGIWTWMAGLNTVGAAGSYGVLGTASIGNAPGARTGAVSWTDAAGNVWLFGGQGNGATTSGYLNDLWEFNPGAQTWTWVSGSKERNAPGTYGTLGTAAAGNTPGARTGASAWVDSLGNLWMFGGIGWDSAGQPGYLNDLWEFNPTAGTWVWVSGSSSSNGNSSYGTVGIPSASNVPGGRDVATSWVDFSGNFWLFGGEGLDSSNSVANPGALGDLWEFSPATDLWTWIDGSSTAGAAGLYPASPGTAGFSYAPGSRQGAAAWVDSGGNFWVLGGSGVDVNGASGYLNDLWKYIP